MEAFNQWPAIQKTVLEKIEMEVLLQAQPLNYNIETSKELGCMGLHRNQLPIHQITLPIAMETFSPQWIKAILPFRVKVKQLLFSAKAISQFY